MPAGRRALSIFAVVGLLGASACQPAAPLATGPAAPPQSLDEATAAPQAAPTSTSPSNVSAPQPTLTTPATQSVTPAVAPTSPPVPRSSPTPTPYLPASSLAALPPDQAETVHEAQSALAAGDAAHAISLLEALLAELVADQQLEVRLLYGHAID